MGIVYGLLMIVFLMAYGMVAVPKSFWKRSNYKSRIKYLLYHVSVIEEKLDDLRMQLSSILKELEDLNVSIDILDYYNLMKDEIEFFKVNNPHFEQECGRMQNNAYDAADRDSIVDLNNVTVQTLEEYRQKLKIGFGDYERIHAMLDYNIMGVMKLQSRVNAYESKEFYDKNAKGFKRITY